MLNLTIASNSSAVTQTPIIAMGLQMRQEFPWLPVSVIEALEHIAEQKVVVPSLELDRQIHSVCLLSRVYVRLNAIMFNHVGHGFQHRPACVSEEMEIGMLQVSPLTQEENDEHADLFGPLVAEMARLEGEGSMVNKRSLAPGFYVREDYLALMAASSVTLQ